MIQRLTAFLGWSNPDLRASLLIGLGSFARIIYQPIGDFAILLPQVGTMALALVPTFHLLNLHEKHKPIKMGSRWVWIPLLTIVAVAVIRIPYILITGNTIWGVDNELASTGYLFCLFLLYVASVNLGAKVFRFMPFLVCLVAASIVLFSAGRLFLGYSPRTGGMLSPANYDIVAVFLIFGALVSPLKHRWWLSGVVVVGLFLAGAEIGLVALVVLGIALLVRKDWSNKLWFPVGVLAIMLAIYTPLGITQQIYTPTYNRISALIHAPFADATDNVSFNKGGGVVNSNNITVATQTIQVSQQDLLLNQATNLRWLEYWKISPIKLLGYGYNIDYFYAPLDNERGVMTAKLVKAGVLNGIPHNEVLIIIEQLGPIALLAWLVATGWLVRKSGWTYAWIGFLALVIFDHELFTVAGAFYFILAGVCQAEKQTVKDYIFRA